MAFVQKSIIKGADCTAVVVQEWMT